MNKTIKYFITIESIMYISFIVLDILNINSSYIKYLGIILCFTYSVLNKNKIISLALLFTLISDYFLLLKEDNYILGVTTFLIVQLIYVFFLHNNECNNLYKIRLSIYVVIVLIFSILKLPILYLITLLYFSTLVMNAIASLSNKKLKIMSIGFFLFIGCDICVGLHNILNNGTLYNIVTIMMWIFYLPSQVLISIGGNKQC